MAYSRDDVQTALELQKRLVAGGIDPDYAAVRIERSIHRLGEGVSALAEDIERSTPAKFRSGSGRTSDREEALIEEIERGGSDQAKGKAYWDEFRANVRREIDEQKKSHPAELAAELDRRTGRAAR